MFVSKMELTISFSELRSILRNSNCKNVENVSQRKLKGILWQKLKEMFILNEIFMTKLKEMFMKNERNFHDQN